jgi:tetratricopeptide (TPR) repeat protein
MSRFFSVQYLLTAGFFALALLSKPMVVSLPIVLLILDWHPFGRGGSIRAFRRLLAEKLPLLALSLVSSVLTVLAQKAGAAIVTVEAIPLARRAPVAAGSLFAYLRKMIYPLDLSPFYPYPKPVPFMSPESFLPFVIAIGVTLVCIAVAKRRRLWLAVWAYYVITLIPVLGIVQVGSQSMADRYTYLPGLGPFLIAGMAAAWAFGKVRPSPAGRVSCCLAAFLVFASMTYITVEQVGVWKSSFTLWNYVIQKEPAVSIAYNNRAVAYYRLGCFDRAVADLERSIELNPHYASALYNMACIYSLRNDAEGACAWLRRSIENGYDNRAHILEDKDFDNIRNTSCYKSIMEGG